jgi:hypothetical protein
MNVAFWCLQRKRDQENRSENMLTNRQKEAIAAALEKHVRDEEYVLAQYRKVAGILRHGPAGLLIRLIFVDEEHHHFLLARLAEDVKAPFDGGAMIELEGRSPAELSVLIGNLAKHEEATIENCRKLKSELAAEGLQLFEAILDAVIADSQKHQRLLLALEAMVVKLPPV